MTLPLLRIRSRAANPHGTTTIRLTMPDDRLDITMHEASARQLVTALHGSLDWIDRQRRHDPKKRGNDLRRIIRDELQRLLTEEHHDDE